MRLCLAGETMLGRGVAKVLSHARPDSLVAPEVIDVAREADLLVLNLECCISERGSPWPDPQKAFFFRAPPSAVELLAYLGVGCVTLANNHALDFGREALVDTLAHLSAAGIPTVGAGANVDEARRPAILSAGGLRIAVLGASDHPRAFAAGRKQPGIALAELEAGVPRWLAEALRDVGADLVLVTPHWGPNMVSQPRPYVRAAAAELLAAGVDLVAGHSAHVFHGVEPGILYDLGGFLDDYAVDPVLRNDLGLLFLVDLDADGPVRLEAVPLELDFCMTRLAEGAEADWIRRRFQAACAALGTEVEEKAGRLLVNFR